jgi:hypothetical protein
VKRGDAGANKRQAGWSRSQERPQEGGPADLPASPLPRGHRRDQERNKQRRPRRGARQGALGRHGPTPPTRGESGSCPPIEPCPLSGPLLPRIQMRMFDRPPLCYHSSPDPSGHSLSHEAHLPPGNDPATTTFNAVRSVHPRPRRANNEANTRPLARSVYERATAIRVSAPFAADHRPQPIIGASASALSSSMSPLARSNTSTVQADEAITQATRRPSRPFNAMA